MTLTFQSSGLDFRVNTTTTDDQGSVALAALPDGGFIATWMSNDQGNSATSQWAWRVLWQRYDAAGTPVGAETEIQPVAGSAHESYPAVTVLADGGWVITWETREAFGSFGQNYNVFGQIFDSTGNLSGDPFRLNTYTAQDQRFSQVTALTGGGFVAIWNSWGQDGDRWGTFGQIFDAAGNKVGAEFRASQSTRGHQAWPQVAALKDGGFVVTYHVNDLSNPDWDSDIFARVFSASGTAVTDEFRVNTYHRYNDDTFGYSKVAGLPGGGFAVAWTGTDQPPNGNGDGREKVMLRLYDANGTAQTNPIRVADIPAVGTASASYWDADWLSVRALPDGSIVLAWIEPGQDGSGTAIRARHFDATGKAVGAAFTVNGATAGHQLYPDLAVLANGDVVVAWQSGGVQDGSRFGVYAQVLDHRIVGTPGDDVLIDLWGADRIDGWAGHDVIEGRTGNDLIYGGLGNDTIFAQEGNDTVRGGAGDDRVYGWYGDDLIDGGDGNDLLVGEYGHNTLLGGAGDDTIFGSVEGNDVIRGGEGNDELHGEDIGASSGGNDDIRGQGGNDTVHAGAGDDYVVGDAGADLIYGGDGADQLWGSEGRDTLGGGAGDDVLTGGAGADGFFFRAGGGNEVIVDFENDVDTLRLDPALWGNAALTRAQVVATYAHVEGADVVLDFGANGLLRLTGLGAPALLVNDTGFIAG
ncbi:MAG: calcium-binding protein [Gemmobacter sp.]